MAARVDVERRCTREANRKECRIEYVYRRSMCRTEEEKSRRMDEVDDVYGYRKAGGVLRGW